jgi:hypothetical protein
MPAFPSLWVQSDTELCAYDVRLAWRQRRLAYQTPGAIEMMALRISRLSVRSKGAEMPGARSPERLNFVESIPQCHTRVLWWLTRIFILSYLLLCLSSVILVSIGVNDFHSRVSFGAHICATGCWIIFDAIQVSAAECTTQTHTNFNAVYLSDWRIATCYGLDGPGIESGHGPIFSLAQTGPRAYPASYTVGTGSLPGVKRPGCDVNHPPLSSAEVKTE